MAAATRCLAVVMLVSVIAAVAVLSHPSFGHIRVSTFRGGRTRDADIVARLQSKQSRVPTSSRSGQSKHKEEKQLFLLISLQRSGSKWAMSNIMANPFVWMKFMEPLSAKSQIQIWGNTTVNTDNEGHNAR